MSDQPSEPSDPVESAEAERVARRAELLPEEESAGSDDPHHQAEEILHESDERTNHPEETGSESADVHPRRAAPPLTEPGAEAAPSC